MYESIHFFPPKLLSIAFPYLYTGLTQTLNRLHLNLYSMNFPSIILYMILWFLFKILILPESPAPSLVEPKISGLQVYLPKYL